MKYTKKTRLKLTANGATAFNLSDDFDPEYPWEEGNIITVEPTTDDLYARYEEDDAGYDNYCIHENMTHCGWDIEFVEDHNNFVPLNNKIKNWKDEFK